MNNRQNVIFLIFSVNILILIHAQVNNSNNANQINKIKL